MISEAKYKKHNTNKQNTTLLKDTTIDKKIIHRLRENIYNMCNQKNFCINHNNKKD